MSGVTRRELLAAGMGLAGAAVEGRARAGDDATTDEERADVEWTTTVGEEFDLAVADVAAAHGGGAVLAANTGDPAGYYLARVTGDGEHDWTLGGRGAMTRALSVARGVDGGYAVAGVDESVDPTAGRLVLFDGDGEGREWVRSFEYPGEDVALNAIERTREDDGYAIGGTVGSDRRGGVVLARADRRGRTTDATETETPDWWRERVDGELQAVTDVAPRAMGPGEVVAVGYARDGDRPVAAVAGYDPFGPSPGYSTRIDAGDASRLDGVSGGFGPTRRVVGTTREDGRERGLVAEVEMFGDVADRWTHEVGGSLRLRDVVPTGKGRLLVGSTADGASDAAGATGSNSSGADGSAPPRRGVVLGVDEEGERRWRLAVDGVDGPGEWLAAATTPDDRAVLGGITPGDPAPDGWTALVEDPPRPDPPDLDVDPLAGYDRDTVELAAAGILADAALLGGGYYLYRRFVDD